MVISAKREAVKKVVKVEDIDELCLEPDGYFPDSKQCDKYHACRYYKIRIFAFIQKYYENILFRDGVAETRLCPDGMVFNDYSIDQEKCDLPYNIDCTKKPALRKCIHMYETVNHKC